MEYILPILFAVLTIVLSILDKKEKERKKAHEAQSVAEVAPENCSHPRLHKREGPADEVSGRGPAEQDVFQGELPHRPREHKDTTPEPLQTKDPKPKLRIDKKNLILYSEILKPKFDA